MKNTKLIFLALLVGLGFGCRPGLPSHLLRDAEGGKRLGGTFRLNMLRGSPNGLDPVRISSKLADDIALNIFDRLITFDSTLGVIGELARTWDISPDGRTYTFHLRTDVRFHDDVCFSNAQGRLMKASDVAYSFGRACDPRTNTVSFWAFQNRVVGAVRYFDACKAGTSSLRGWPDGISVLDDSTFSIQLEAPFAPFLLTLANGFGCVVPHEAVEHYGENFNRHPVGTGPFRFDHWEEDRSMILVRNPKYWQRDATGNQLPLLDTVFISFIKDDNVQFLSFQQGDLDECFTIPTEIFPSIINRSLTDGSVRMHEKFSQYQLQATPAWCTWFVDFLCTQKPFRDDRVRRAFALSIDRHRIVRYVLANAPAAPAEGGITPPVLPSYQTKSIVGLGFDPARARAELAAAGYQDGKGLEGLVLTIYPEPRLKQCAEALQEMWQEHLNVDVRIEIVQFAQFLSMAEEGKFLMWGTRWYGDYPDAETFLTLFNGDLLPRDPNAASYPNSSRINDSLATSLIRLGVNEPRVEKRHAYYAEAEARLAHMAPSALLFYEMHYRLLQPYVRGYPLDPMARIVLKHMWFAW
ncbi:MAG: ABC transporter substrate-binding protein [bacterium]|nr:ABC transporter substrate-binding protein [bacterium]